MAPLTLLRVFLVLVPASSNRQKKHEEVWSQLQQASDPYALAYLLNREGERASITIGIVPALLHWTQIERFLEANKDFALGFGTTVRNVVYLAHLYLDQGE